MSCDELVESGYGDMGECQCTVSGVKDLTEAHVAPNIELLSSSTSNDYVDRSGLECMNGDGEVVNTM